jgi:hypothetical protein
MHRYRIVAQISLILSILNLVLAAPIVVQEIHEARADEVVVAEDVPATPNMSGELEAASGGSTSRPPSPESDFGRDGISAAFVFVGRVDVFGLSCPAFVIGWVGFRLFVVVGQAAASESAPSSVIVAWAGASSPFKFRVTADRSSSVDVVTGDSIISATYGVGFGDDRDLFAGKVYAFAPFMIVHGQDNCENAVK